MYHSTTSHYSHQMRLTRRLNGRPSLHGPATLSGDPAPDRRPRHEQRYVDILTGLLTLPTRYRWLASCGLDPCAVSPPGARRLSAVDKTEAVPGQHRTS